MKEKVEPRIKKDEEIICKNGHIIAISKIDIYTKDMMYAKDFEWKQKIYKDGDKLKPCSICKEDWFDGSQSYNSGYLYTKTLLKAKYSNSPDQSAH